MSPPRLVLVTRAGCHLCEEGRSIVERLRRSGVGFELEVLDVDSDPALTALYGSEVPVLLRDGRKIAKLRFDERRLRRSLGS
jgi:hypothetical protein